jgi:Rrf2 family protein
MIHLSTKSDYAIKALVRLTLANGDGPVQARQISEFAGIPAKFLEQVMHDLRQGGLVHSQRGKGGGYVLAVDPAELTFADVIDLIDGSHGGMGRMPRSDQAEPLVAPVWREVRECTRAVLGSATIADAAARASDSPIMYYI